MTLFLSDLVTEKSLSEDVVLCFHCFLLNSWCALARRLGNQLVGTTFVLPIVAVVGQRWQEGRYYMIDRFYKPFFFFLILHLGIVLWSLYGRGFFGVDQYGGTFVLALVVTIFYRSKFKQQKKKKSSAIHFTSSSHRFDLRCLRASSLYLSLRWFCRLKFVYGEGATHEGRSDAPS
jgi:hypothetical protein